MGTVLHIRDEKMVSFLKDIALEMVESLFIRTQNDIGNALKPKLHLPFKA